ncbi:MAG: bifunctional nuclease family protein, partial [Candidatus Sericytochromatia bacterium]
MVIMKVSGIVLDPQSKSPILVLRDLEDRKALLIWIGPPEANAIMLVLENIKLSRPSTHDLIIES